MKNFFLYQVLLLTCLLQGSEQGRLHNNFERALELYENNLPEAPPVTPADLDLTGRVSADSSKPLVDFHVSGHFLPRDTSSAFNESYRSPSKSEGFKPDQSKSLGIIRRPGRKHIVAKDPLPDTTLTAFQESYKQVAHRNSKAQTAESTVTKLPDDRGYELSREERTEMDTGVIHKIQSFRRSAKPGDLTAANVLRDSYYTLLNKLCVKENRNRQKREKQRLASIQYLRKLFLQQKEHLNYTFSALRGLEKLRLKFESMHEDFLQNLRLEEALGKELTSRFQNLRERREQEAEDFLIAHIDRIMQGSDIMNINA